MYLINWHLKVCQPQSSFQQSCSTWLMRIPDQCPICWNKILISLVLKPSKKHWTWASLPFCYFNDKSKSSPCLAGFFYCSHFKSLLFLVSLAYTHLLSLHAPPALSVNKKTILGNSRYTHICMHHHPCVRPCLCQKVWICWLSTSAFMMLPGWCCFETFYLSENNLLPTVCDWSNMKIVIRALRRRSLTRQCPDFVLLYWGEKSSLI